jgi:hypothetical protein
MAVASWRQNNANIVTIIILRITALFVMLPAQGLEFRLASAILPDGSVISDAPPAAVSCLKRHSPVKANGPRLQTKPKMVSNTLFSDLAKLNPADAKRFPSNYLSGPGPGDKYIIPARVWPARRVPARLRPPAWL